MTINSTTRKTNVLVGNGNTHTYPFAFKVFKDEDVVVKKLEAATSIETTLTLGVSNDYIVTLSADQNSNPGGSITLKSGGNNQNLASGFSIVITSAVEPLQGTDLTNQGGFFPEVINDALDKAVVLHQQQQEELNRSIKFSLTNTIGSLEINENAAARKNRVLGFDNSGEFEVLKELGTWRGDWAASTSYVVRDLVKDTSTGNVFFCNVAHTSSGAQPLTTNTDSAKWDLMVDAATATTASTNAASSATAAATSATAAATSATAAATSATSAASSATTATTKATAADTAKTAAETAKTAAETAKTAAETALDTFDDRYLGAKSSDPTLDNDGDALIDGALYFNTTVNRTKIYDLGNTSWLEVTITGSDLTNTNTVAGAISNVNAVGGNISNVNAVAGNATNINAVNSNASNINTVAGNNANITTVAGANSNITTVATNISNVNTVAADIAKVVTVANDLNETVSEIETAAADLQETTSEIDTVAAAITNVDNVGNNIANVNTVAGIASNVTAVAGNATNINTVGGAITNVNNVGGSIANVNTCATNLAGINSFAERYRTDNSGNNPSTSLNAGDLFFNQGSGKLLVYNALANNNNGAWEETQSVGNFFINTISTFSGTGGNASSFDGTAYKFTLSNAGQFAQQMLVSINGVIQKPNANATSQPSEGFTLDGANIIFAAPPPAGADYFIVTIGASVSIGTPTDETITLAKFVHGTSGNNGKFLRSNNGADPSWETISSDKITVNDTTAEVTDTGSNGTFKITFDGAANESFRVTDTNLYLGRNATNAANSNIHLSGAIKFGFTNAGTSPYIRTDGSGYLEITGAYNAGSSIGTVWTFGGYQGTHKSNGNINPYADSTYSLGTDALRWTNVYADNLYGDGTNITGINTDLVSDTSPQLGGNLDVNTKNILFGNSSDGASDDVLIFGSGSDLKLYHDGNNSIIKHDGTGTLYISTGSSAESLFLSGGADVYIRTNASDASIDCIDSGAVKLYHSGNIRLETTSDGATVSGASDGVFNLDTSDNRGAFIRFGQGGSYYSMVGCADGLTTGDKEDLAIRSSDNIYFATGGSTARASFDSSGHFKPVSNGTYDLGSSSLRWRNIYTNDLNLSNEGSTNDVDGTWGSYTIQEGAEDLFLVNKRNGKKYKFNLTEVN